MHFVSFKSLFCLRYGYFKFGRDIYSRGLEIPEKNSILATPWKKQFSLHEPGFNLIE